MRHIGTIADETQAEKFSAYLTVRGIANQLEPDRGQFDIWVKDEDQLDRANAELVKFQEEPGHQRYEQSVELAHTIKKEHEEKRAKASKNIVNVRDGLSHQRNRYQAPLTKVLIILAIGVTLFGGTSLRGVNSKTFENPVYRAMIFNSMDGANAKAILEARKGDDDDINFRLSSIFRGELWRTITPIFVHYGLIHLAFNCFMLFQLGGLLEHRHGTVFMGGLVILTSIIPNLLQGMVPEALDGSVPHYVEEVGWLIRTNFGGLSGVLYGVFGYLWIRSTLDPWVGYRIPSSTVIILIGWMFLGIFHVFGDALNMANWAHGGGLVVGMVVAYLSSLLGKPE